jgi:hypothetical protein
MGLGLSEACWDQKVPKVSIVLFVCSVVACAARTPTAPRVAIDSQFTLAPGGSASIEGTSVQVRLDRVVSDSRCPTDVNCIQAGDAVVRITVTSDGGTQTDELHTGAGGPHSAARAGLTITLEDLSPQPVSSRPTPPGNYRATFRATR